MKFRKIIKRLKQGYTLFINGTPIIYNGDNYILQNDIFSPDLLRRSAILDGLKKYKNIELWKG